MSSFSPASNVFFLQESMLVFLIFEIYLIMDNKNMTHLLTVKVLTITWKNLLNKILTTNTNQNSFFYFLLFFRVNAEYTYYVNGTCICCCSCSCKLIRFKSLFHINLCTIRISYVQSCSTMWYKNKGVFGTCCNLYLITDNSAAIIL